MSYHLQLLISLIANSHNQPLLSNNPLTHFLLLSFTHFLLLSFTYIVIPPLSHPHSLTIKWLTLGSTSNHIDTTSITSSLIYHSANQCHHSLLQRINAVPLAVRKASWVQDFSDDSDEGKQVKSAAAAAAQNNADSCLLFTSHSKYRSSCLRSNQVYELNRGSDRQTVYLVL